MRRIAFRAISLTMLVMLVLMLSILADANTPLSLLQHRSGPVHAVSLSGISPESALTIAGLNENLTAWKYRPLADLGKYFSGVRTLDNGLAGIPVVLINFSKSDVPMTPSIDTEAGNEAQAPIATEANGYAYL